MSNLAPALAILSLFAALAAATAAEAKQPTVTYIVNGKIVNAFQAIDASLAGKEVLGCRVMEAKPSKTGTSIALRIKKAQ